MDILRSIMAERLADSRESAARFPIDVLKAKAEGWTHHSLVEALTNRAGTRVIAEMKKASPSAGLLREDYRPADLAQVYGTAGAAGLSVLTEPRHFLGSAQHLREARRSTDIPILRKDFIGDPYQVVETAAWGADVILLIVAALPERDLRALYERALEYGLDVLVEAHTEEEVDMALVMEKAIVGVNSRNLKTLQTDLAVARKLAARIPRDRLSIAESGIKTRADIEDLQELGYDGFLIGESLVGASDPGRKLADFLGA